MPGWGWASMGIGVAVAESTLGRADAIACAGVRGSQRSMNADAGSVLQHFQGWHPEIRPEYSELLHMIGPDDPTLERRCRVAGDRVATCSYLFPAAT